VATAQETHDGILKQKGAALKERGPDPATSGGLGRDASSHGRQNGRAARKRVVPHAG